MSVDHGEGLAPVIPLFGGSQAVHPTRRTPAVHDRDTARVGDSAADRSVSDDGAGGGGASPAPDGEGWHTTWRDLGSGERRLAPAPTVTTTVRDGVRFVELPEGGDDSADPLDDDGDIPTDIAAAAEERLVKALRSRSLSESEARSRLRREGVPEDAVEDIVRRLSRIGALDDAALAEQLVHIGVSRKNQGRRAIAQALATRGIARETVDAALDGLPDDDRERALEFARGKTSSLVRFDDDTAVRRLVGQLARRGFGGGLAMTAARTALDEARRGGGGVRFR